MVGVGDGVGLGDGVKLGVAVAPNRVFCGSVQAVSSARVHNHKRIFFIFMALLILVNGGAVNLNLPIWCLVAVLFRVQTWSAA